MGTHINRGDATDNTVPLNVQFEPVVGNWQHHYSEGQPVWFKRTFSVPGVNSSVRVVAAFQVQVLNYLFVSARRQLNGQLTEEPRKRQRRDRTAIPPESGVPDDEFVQLFGEVIPLTPRACDAIYNFAGIIAINGSEQPARLPKHIARDTYMMSNVRAQGLYDRIINYWGTVKEGTRIGFGATMVDLTNSPYRDPAGHVLSPTGTAGLTLQLIPMISEHGSRPISIGDPRPTPSLNVDMSIEHRMHYVTNRSDEAALIDWKTPNDTLDQSTAMVEKTVMFGKFFQVGLVYIGVEDNSSKSTVADRMTRLIVPDAQSRVFISIQHGSHFVPQ